MNYGDCEIAELRVFLHSFYIFFPEIILLSILDTAFGIIKLNFYYLLLEFSFGGLKMTGLMDCGDFVIILLMLFLSTVS